MVTLLTLRVREAERNSTQLTSEQTDQLREEIRQTYEMQTDIRYAAARGWVDAVIAPHETRNWLAAALSWIPADLSRREFRTGVMQV